jgi:MFS family permease
MFSAFSFGQFLGEPFWGKLSDRIGRRPVLIVTISGVALSYAALAFAPNIWAALVIRFVNGVLAGNISTLQGVLADITPPEKRAGRMGIMGAAFSAGFTTGPAIGGYLAQPSRGVLGFQLPLLAAAAFAVASVIAVVFLVRETRVQTEASALRQVRSARLREGLRPSGDQPGGDDQLHRGDRLRRHRGHLRPVDRETLRLGPAPDRHRLRPDRHPGRGLPGLAVRAASPAPTARRAR